VVFFFKFLNLKSIPYFFGLLLILPALAQAQTEPPQFMTVDGRLYDSTTPDDPLLDNSVLMKIQVLNPAKTCILYEEEQTVSTLSSNGYFNVRVGSPTSGGDSLKRTTNDSGNSMMEVFQNQAAVIAGRTSGGAGCSFTPSAGDTRYFRYIVTPSTTGVTSTLSPDMQIDSVPQSLVAETLQGMTPANFVQTNTDVTQAKVNSLFGASYAGLTGLLAGSSSLYLQNTTNGTVIPSRATNPLTPAAGQIWYDSDDFVLRYYDGTVVQTLSSGSADPTKLPLAGGSMSGAIDMGTNDITDIGHMTQAPQQTFRFGVYTTAQQATLVATPLIAGHEGTVWYNTTTNKLMFWDGTAEYAVAPVESVFGRTGAVVAAAGDYDANQIDNAPAGTIAATEVQAAINELDSEKVAKAGDTMTGSLNIDNEQELRLSEADGSGANYIGIKALTTLGANYTLTLPGTAGSASQVLTTDGTGLLSWTSLAAVGESNTASNQGVGGVGTFDAKSGVDLQFRNINAASNKVSVALDAGNKEIDINVNEANLDSAVIPNTAAGTIAATNVQAAINELDTDKVATTRAINTAAGSGLAGGGDLSADRSLSVNINGTTAETVVAGADEILIYDASATALRKMTRTNFVLSESEVDAMVSNNGFLSAEADTLATVTGRGASTATNITLNTQAQVRFADSAGGEYAAIQAPATIGTNYVLTLPDTAGSASQVLTTNGSGVLSWTTPSTTPAADSLDFTHFADAMTLDASTDIAVGANVLSVTNDGAGNSFRVNDNGAADASPFVIDASGNVGIGTSNPSHTLTVENLSGGVPGLLVLRGGFTAADLGVSMSFRSNGGVDYARIQGLRGTASNNGYLSLIVQDAGVMSEKVRISSSGNVGIGTTAPATKLDVEGTIQIADGGETCTIAANAGMVKYAAGTLQYCNGSSWQTLGVSGAGLTTFNSQTGSTQTLANGSTGLAPNWSSASDIHTLHIPLASGAGVTSGTITKTEYDSFVAKVAATRTIGTAADSGLSGGGDLSADRNLAVNITGTTALGAAADNADEILIYDTSGTVLRKVTRAQLNLSEAEVDAFVANNGYAAAASYVAKTGDSMDGALTFNTQNQARFADSAGGEYAAIQAPTTIGTNYVLTLPDTAGSASQVLTTNGSGVLSWTTPSTTPGADSLDFSHFADAMTLDVSTDIAASGTNALSITNSGTGDSFRVNDAAGDTTPFIIDAAGSVGVGTTAPSSQLHARTSDAATNTITNVLRLEHESTGTPAAGFGTGLMFSGKTSTTSNQNMARISSVWTTATHGTHASALAFSTLTNGTIAEHMRIDESGNVGIRTTVPGTRLDVAGAITSRPFGTSTGETGQLIMRELAADGTETATIRAPDAITTSYSLTLPTTAGAAGQVLQTDGTGILTWITAATAVADDSLNFDKFSDTMTLDASTDIAATGTNFLSVTNSGTGDSFRVNDQAADTSPFVIDANGNVGIGTTAPTGELHIQGTTSGANLILSDNDTSRGLELIGDNRPGIQALGLATLEISPNGWPAVVGTAGSMPGSFFEILTTGNVADYFNISSLDTENGDIFKVSGAGRVGIGTATPGTLLDVAGAITSRPFGAGAGQTGQIIMRELAAGGTDTVAIRAPDALGASYALTLPLDDGTSGQVLSTDGNGILSWISAPANGGTFLAGSGTALLPSYSFQADPDTGFYHTGTDGEIGFTSNGAHRISFRSAAISNSGVVGGFQLKLNGVGTAGAPTYTFHNYGDVGMFAPADDVLAFSTSATERMRIDASGNVGVGTTIPGTILDAAGAITSRPSGTGTGQTGQLIMRELAVGGTETATIRAPDAITTSYALTLPADDGASGQVLSTDGAGILSWVSAGADNLGNHTATQNIILGANYLSGDGGAGEGIAVSSTGRVTVSEEIIGRRILARGNETESQLGFTSTQAFLLRLSNVDFISARKDTLSELSLAPETADVDDLYVGGKTTPDIHINMDNNWVGINRLNPTTTLDVGGEILARPRGTLTGETGSIQLAELAAGGSETVRIRAPDAITTSYALTLPTTAGATGQVLQTDGTGVLTWITAATAVADDSLNFDKFSDTMTLDASTDIAATGTNFLSVTNSGTGDSFRVNDQAADTTPFVIDTSGNVGVGTTTPGRNLDVVGTLRASGDVSITSGTGSSSSGTGALVVSGGLGVGGNIYAGSVLYGQGAIITRSEPTLYSPSSVVSGDPSMIPVLRARNTSGTNGVAAYLNLESRNSSGNYQSAYMATVSVAGAGAYSPNIVIGRQTGATAYNELIRIDSNGNIGIGTTAPGTILDVAGAITSRPLGTLTGETGQFIMRELAAGGTETATIRAPDAITTSYALTLPTTAGAAGQVLQTDGTGVLSWISAATAVADDSLNFDKFSDTMTLDASTDIAVGGNVLAVTNDGAGTTLQVNDNGAADTTPFLIDANGNVGIREATPGAALHIDTGGASANGQIRTDNNSSNLTSGIDFYRSSSATFSGFVGYRGTASAGAGFNTTGVWLASTEFGLPVIIGTGTGTASERMRIDAGGSVGIGTTAPDTRLHTVSNDAATNVVTNVLRVGHDTSGTPAANYGTGLIFAGESSTTINQDMAGVDAIWTTATHASRASALRFSTLTGGGALSEKMRIDGNGFVGILNNAPSVALDVTGDVEYSGTLTDVSDRRLKENILPLHGALENILQIEGVSFVMKNDPDKRKEIGVIAQDVEAVFPELVRTKKDALKTKSVNYMGFIGYIIEAIKQMYAELNQKDLEHDKQIAEMQAEIKKLQLQNQQLMEKLQRAPAQK
jgi:fibronectin-binding autotransporter adhesin